MMHLRRPLAAGASGLISWALLAAHALAAEPVSFKGKTVAMIVAYAAGGGTDLTGRLVAPYLTKYLPGNPTFIVQNMPGAGGTRAMSYILRTQPDGLSVLMGAGSAVDPALYRAANLGYKPEDYRVIGGFGRG